MALCTEKTSTGFQLTKNKNDKTRSSPTKKSHTRFGVHEILTRIADLLTIGCHKAGPNHGNWTKHYIVGLSSLCYILPSVTYLRFQHTILGLMYALVALVSSMADYVFLPNDNQEEIIREIRATERGGNGIRPQLLMEVIDRIVAISVAWVSFWWTFIKSGPLVALVCLAVSAAAITWSRKSKTKESWVIRHSLWHLISSIMVTIGVLFSEI